MRDPLTLISICSLVLPTVASLLTVRKYRLSAGMLCLFISGLITEQVMIHNRTLGDAIVFDLYCLIECAIFIWIVNQRRNALRWSSFFKGFLLIALPLWIVSMLVFPQSEIVILSKTIKGTEIFNSFYQVCIAFIAAMELLRMVESKDDLINFPAFWILLGIFTYCFGTFFMMIFINEALAKKIWYVHNLINVLTYIIYTIGMLKAFRLRTSKERSYWSG